LPSGLQYKVVTPGKGESPKPTSTVTVDYEGKLINGKVFDSSYARHQSISFALNQVIPGWTEGVGLMKPGETAILYIPGYLAYGSQGVPGTIPPDATLVFKIHLISVQN
jgi:FKBP-type peptidyl-prolyl cis-trans isomerase FkpA